MSRESDTPMEVVLWRAIWRAALADDPGFEVNHPDDWEILLEPAGVGAEEAPR